MKVSLLFILLCNSVWPTSASYIFEVMLHSYSNPESRDSDGLACEGLFCIFDCECDNQFTFCLRMSGSARPQDDTPANCAVETIQTGEFEDNDSIAFGTFLRANLVTNPLTYTGQTWLGSFQLYVRVVDVDPFNSDDVVDDIYIDMSLAVSDSFTTRQIFTGIHDNGRLELSFRVQCNPPGSSCTGTSSTGFTTTTTTLGVDTTRTTRTVDTTRTTTVDTTEVDTTRTTTVDTTEIDTTRTATADTTEIDTTRTTTVDTTEVDTTRTATADTTEVDTTGLSPTVDTTRPIRADAAGNNDDDTLPLGSIVGGAVAGVVLIIIMSVVLIIIIIAVAAVMIKRSNERHLDNSAPPEYENTFEGNTFEGNVYVKNATQYSQDTMMSTLKDSPTLDLPPYSKAESPAGGDI